MVSLASVADAKAWFDRQGLTDIEWGDLEDSQQTLLRLTAVLDGWPEVSHMREAGMPGNTQLVYVIPEYVGLDTGDCEFAFNPENSYEALTALVVQNASGNIRSLFYSPNVNVESVSLIGDDPKLIQLEVYPTPLSDGT